MSRFQDIDYLRNLYGEERQIPLRGEFLKKYSNRNRSVRDVMRSLMGDFGGKKILDIGAGSGSFLLKIKKENPSIKATAIDIVSHPNLSGNRDVSYRIYDGNHLPNDIGKFDIILMMHMLYHISDIESFLSQVLAAYGKAGTKLYITTKSKDTMFTIEDNFQHILRLLELPYDTRYNERDEAHFCRENAQSIIEKSFKDTSHSVKEYDLDTQLLVDNPDDLLEYILSTPRYGDDANLLSDPRYIEYWKSQINKHDLFIDTYRESIYVVEF